MTGQHCNWPETPRATSEDLALCNNKEKVDIRRDGCEFASLHPQTQKTAAAHNPQVFLESTYYSFKKGQKEGA